MLYLKTCNCKYTTIMSDDIEYYDEYSDSEPETDQEIVTIFGYGILGVSLDRY